MNKTPLDNSKTVEFDKDQLQKARIKTRRKKIAILLSTCAALGALGLLILFLIAQWIVPKCMAVIEWFDSFNETEITESYNKPSLPNEGVYYPPAPNTEIESLSPSLSLSPEISESPSASPSEEPMHITTIYIDAGHGALSQSGVMDYGTGKNSPYYNLAIQKTGKEMYESDLNLAIALKVEKLLEDEGYVVIMSREGYLNSTFTVNQRASAVNETNADVFVSIHGNSSVPSAKGAQVYYYNGERDDINDCAALANAVAKAIDRNNASKKKASVLKDDFAVVRDTNIPSILVETCFLTNEEDAKQALTEEWQNSMAKAIYEGIKELYPLKITFN